MIKRILALHDLSGFGSGSLMAVIPIMHRHGIQVTAIPTALLSANTCYDDYAYLDSSQYLVDSIRHYQELKRSFNAIYSGFLGSPLQVDTVIGALQSLASPDTLKVIDPVMADDGELYGCYDQTMVLAMRRLIKEADIITPNFTEACFLADWKYHSNYDDTELLQLCEKLHSLGAKELIITSVPGVDDGSSRVLYYTLESGLQSFDSDYIPAFYPGTGDIFCSLILAGILSGKALPAAIQIAIAFIHKAILFSIEHGEDAREGVNLEKLLWDEAFDR